MGKYKYVLFDLDGTLMDTSDGVMKSVEYTVNELGYPPLAPECVRKFIGPPITDSLRKQFDLSDEQARVATKIFRDAYKDKFLYYAKPYPGIQWLITALDNAGIKTAVATYKRDDYAKKLLDHYEMLAPFDFAMGADDNNVLKKSDIVKTCLEKLGCTDYNDAVLIGDTYHDATGAEQIGVHFVAVTFGFGFRNISDTEEYNCDAVCSNVEELADVLL